MLQETPGHFTVRFKYTGPMPLPYPHGGPGGRGWLSLSIQCWCAAGLFAPPSYRWGTHIQVNIPAQSWESRTESLCLKTHACPGACWPCRGGGVGGSFLPQGACSPSSEHFQPSSYGRVVLCPHGHQGAQQRRGLGRPTEGRPQRLVESWNPGPEGSTWAWF